MKLVAVDTAISVYMYYLSVSQCAFGGADARAVGRASVVAASHFWLKGAVLEGSAFGAKKFRVNFIHGHMPDTGNVDICVSIPPKEIATLQIITSTWNFAQKSE